MSKTHTVLTSIFNGGGIRSKPVDSIAWEQEADAYRAHTCQEQRLCVYEQGKAHATVVLLRTSNNGAWGSWRPS